MLNQIPVEFVSNIVSIILVFILIYNYLKYKKIVDVIKKLDDLKIEKKLTSDDISYIFENEKEYNEKAQKTEAFAKFMNPLFILIVGILFIYLPFSDAMILLKSESAKIFAASTFLNLIVFHSSDILFIFSFCIFPTSSIAKSHCFV